MTTDQAIKHFGSHAELAKALHIQAPSVYGWGEYPPPLRQVQMQAVTKGALKAEPGVYSVPTKRAKATA